jgi:Zn-dependent protease with chaperone function
MKRSVLTRRKKRLIQKDQEIPIETRLHQFNQLILAIQENRANDIPDIIKAGADISFVLDRNVTALHLAVATDHIECIPPLLQAGADVNVKTCNGYTALHLAAENANKDMLLALLNAKADVLATDEDDDAALHFAVRKGNVECVQELLKAGASFKVFNKKGASPFILAAYLNHAEIIRELATWGCVSAQQTLEKWEEATKIKEPSSFGSKIASFLGKTSWRLGNLIPQKIKDVSYTLAQFGIGLAVPYVLDIPTPIMVVSAILATGLIMKKYLSDLKTLKAGVIPDTKDAAPLEIDPELVQFALTYTQALAVELGLGEVRIAFDQSEKNRGNARAFYQTNSIFINQELLTKSTPKHKLQAVIAHEVQHLHLNKHWFTKVRKTTSNFLKGIILFTMQADFWSKMAVQLSPFRIPYLTDIIGSRLFYTKERIAIQLLVHLVVTQMARDEEYNADNGALLETKDASLEKVLVDTFLCLKAQEIARVDMPNEQQPKNDNLDNGWESKEFIPSLFGLFKHTHPPIIDRIKNLQERKTQLSLSRP